MKPDISNVEQMLAGFSPISLEEVKTVRLMDRVETKYIAPASAMVSLLDALKDNFFVQEIEGKRIAQYNTTYYDTDDALMFNSHSQGLIRRIKIRFRTYLNTGESYIEVKRKNNRGHTKKSREKCDEKDPYSLKSHDEFLRTRSGLSPDNISPYLDTSFSRITLSDKKHAERLTIDFGLTFRNLRNGAEADLNEILIIELKQQANVLSPTKELMDELMIRKLRFSKYYVGCGITNPEIQDHKLKKRLRKIHRIARQQ